MKIPMTTAEHLAARRMRVIQRVLAGRKRVSVAAFKWGHPQAIDTLQRVTLPERRSDRAVLRFSEFVEMLE
jgi:hypothetical protein